jgi:small subunit ribosomal protein S16
MSVRVRLTRVGSRKNPIWRVVVADQRSPRDGRFIETIGHYNAQTEPSTIAIDDDRLRHWLARGAQPTGTVKQLIKAHAKGVAAAAEPVAEAPQPQPAPADAGEGEPESAPPGEPAPGAGEQLEADPEAAPAERGESAPAGGGESAPAAGGESAPAADGESAPAERGDSA